MTHAKTQRRQERKVLNETRQRLGLRAILRRFGIARGFAIDAERSWSFEDKCVPKLELGNKGKNL